MQGSEFIHPLQTKEQRKKNEDPRVQISGILQGPTRQEGESFEDYKMNESRE